MPRDRHAADEAATLERSDDKLCDGVSGDGDAPGGGSGGGGLEKLLVLTHGADGADYGAVLNVSDQARVSIGGADVKNFSVCKMTFSHGTAKSNDRLKRVRSIARA